MSGVGLLGHVYRINRSRVFLSNEQKDKICLLDLRACAIYLLLACPLDLALLLDGLSSDSLPVFAFRKVQLRAQESVLLSALVCALGLHYCHAVAKSQELQAY